MTESTLSDISAVVCTRNSMPGIRECLNSLRVAGVGEIIVVDASSIDGTRQVAETHADEVITDEGIGLGHARNLGIARTTRSFILNMGSDNVVAPEQLTRMLAGLRSSEFAGVSAQTVIRGDDWVSRGLNAWRRGRFTPGEKNVIGTPTLFYAELIKRHPYLSSRRFSDDSELCERWRKEFGARFAITEAQFMEVGKSTWPEVVVRCRMYGESDYEVYHNGVASGWSRARRIKSVLHPLRADFITPLRNLDKKSAVFALPFLATFTTLRYASWIEHAWHARRTTSTSPRKV